MNVRPLSASSWPPTPRMLLADRQTEENLLRGLAEQKEAMREGLEACLDVSYNCAQGYNQDLVRPTGRDKWATNLLRVAVVSIPLELVTLACPSNPITSGLTIGLCFLGLGSFLGGLVLSSSSSPPPTEQNWRARTRNDIEALRGEAGDLRAQARRVYDETHTLRLACPTAGNKTGIDVSEQNVTLGGVRIKRKG